MKKAQMGGAYAQRRAYKSAGAPKKTQESKAPGFGKDIPGKEGGKSRVNMAEREKRIKAKESTERQQKSSDDYYTGLASAPKKGAASKSSPAKRKLVRTAAATISAPKREMPSTAVTAPKVSGIQSRPEGRKYSEKEIKIMEAMKKGKKADGTMKTSAQRKIQRIRRSK